MADDLVLSSDKGEEARPVIKGRSTDWWGEVKGIFWLVVAVLGFHSLVAKPFYIPSESMLPGLLVGDRLVVTKYPYGYSYITPTFHVLPFMHGRLFGRLPERGDVVIVTPPGSKSDYIKRVIGLPGDTIEIRGGAVILNGTPIQRGPLHFVDIPDYGGVTMQDGRITCEAGVYGAQARGANGKLACHLPIVTETMPNGRRYDTVDLGPSMGDDYGPITVPKGTAFLMGDNRDNSADSRVPVALGGLGGPVPLENIGGRAEFLTFSLDGSASWNPLTWPGSFRSGRAGRSLHAERVR